VLEEHSDARMISFRAGIESLIRAGILIASGAERLLGCLTPEGAIRLLPGTFHTDGFFIALIQRGD
jgi:16S rRNA C967 or C1407 C5-methylase (RsmB/RsmF family)